MLRALRSSTVLSIALSPLAVAQVQLEFGSPSATYSSVLQLRNGDRLFVGSALGSNRNSVLVLTLLGKTSGIPSDFAGNGNTVPSAAALDPSGNIWIVG